MRDCWSPLHLFAINDRQLHVEFTTNIRRLIVLCLLGQLMLAKCCSWPRRPAFTCFTCVHNIEASKASAAKSTKLSAVLRRRQSSAAPALRPASHEAGCQLVDAAGFS